MRVFRASIEIAAPPAAVWDVLVDLPSYPSWNPFTVSAESTLEVGAPIDLMVRMSARDVRPQREYIRSIEPGVQVSWGMKLGAPFIVSGERCQSLHPLPDGGTRYVTEDRIGGLLSPVVFALFGASIERGFASLAEALKVEVERRG